MRYLLLMLVLLIARPVLGCDPDRIQSMRPASDEYLAALADCLASPDPGLRDQFAYTSLVSLLRDQRPADGQLEFLWDQLDRLLQQPDPVGVAHPFAVLVLAEIARTDRIEAWMSDTQRQEMVDTAGNYLESVLHPERRPDSARPCVVQ